jgi:antitoxin HigA-1
MTRPLPSPSRARSRPIAGQRAISADTDLRLCRVLGLSPGYWLRAQAAHDTEVASAELADELERIQPLVNG